MALSEEMLEKMRKNENKQIGGTKAEVKEPTSELPPRPSKAPVQSANKEDKKSSDTAQKNNEQEAAKTESKAKSGKKAEPKKESKSDSGVDKLFEKKDRVELKSCTYNIKVSNAEKIKELAKKYNMSNSAVLDTILDDVFSK